MPGWTLSWIISQADAMTELRTIGHALRDYEIKLIREGALKDYEIAKAMEQMLTLVNTEIDMSTTAEDTVPILLVTGVIH